MARYAEVEGVGTLEFPDDTPDDVVAQTVRKVVGGAGEDQPSFVGDLANRFRRGGAVAVGRTAQAIARGGYAIERLVGEDADVPPAEREARLRERSDLYRGGESLVEGAQEAFPSDPVRDGSLSATIAESAGAMVPTILSGVAGRAAAAVQYGLTAGEGAAQEAVEAGQPEKADAAFAYTAPIGAITELALGVPSRLIPGLRAGRVNVGAAIAKGAVKESVQEGLEQIGQNVVASGLVGYDPERPAMQGVPMSMLAGAALGGPLSGVGAAIARANTPDEVPPESTVPDVPEPEVSEFGGITGVEEAVARANTPNEVPIDSPVAEAVAEPSVEPEAPMPPDAVPADEVAAAPLVDPDQAPQPEAPVETPDRIDAFLTKAIDALTAPSGVLYSDPLLLQTVGRPALRGALLAVRAAYRGTRSVIDAVEAGVQWLRGQNLPFDEGRFRTWAAGHFAEGRQEAPPAAAATAAATPPATPPGSPPPPAAVPPAPAAVPTELERKLSPRLQEADWLTPEVRQQIRNRTYESTSMAASEAAGQQLVADLGPERAERLVFDSSLGVPMAVRGGLTAAIAQEYSRLERTATDPAVAKAYRDKNADYMSRLLPMTTEFGQFINMLKAFSWQTAEGAVLTARRLIEQAMETHLAAYQTLIRAARAALRGAHDAAITDTVNDPGVQGAAAAAVDQAVVNDDEIRRLIRGRVVEDMEPDIRTQVTEAGFDGDRVVAALNQFWGPNPQPAGLVPLLEAAGVPQDQATAWANAWINRFRHAVGKVEWNIRQTLASERTRSARVRALGSLWTREREDAARGLVTALTAGRRNPTQQGAVQELASRVARRLREQVKARNRTAPKLTDLELLREAANNFDRYQEVWDAAWSQARADGLKGVVAQLEQGQPQPFADARVDRAIREKLRDWNMRMGDAVRRSRSAQSGKLGDIIATDAGLDSNSPAHQRLRDAINQRWDTVATARKRREIEKLLRDQPDEGTERQLKSVLRRFVDLHDLGALDDAQYFNAIRDGLGMRNLTPADLAKLRKLANSLSAVPADQQFRRQEATIRLLNELEKIRKPVRWWEWPMAIWYANILSAVATQTVNLMSNAMNLAGNLTVQMVRNPSAIPATMTAVGRGISKGIPEALNVLSTGIVSGQRIGDKFGDPRFFQKVDNAWLMPWAMIGRALAAGDMLFFHPASEARQALLARSVARREGLSGQALRQRTQDLLANTPAMRSNAAVQATREGFTGLRHRRRVEEILQAHRDATGEFTQTGREFALASTFNNTPYGLLGLFAKAINGVTRGAPYAKLVVPFTNIVANVVNEGLNYTPWGSFRALVSRWGGVYGEDRDVSSWSQRELLADLHAKAAVGTLLLYVVFLKAAKEADKDEPEFMITGQGPKDSGRRDTLKAAGWMPNSIKVGGRYYSFQQTPVAVPLAGLGNYFDAIRYGKLSEASAMERLTYALAGTAKSVVQQSFLDGLARLVGAIERPSETGTAENMAAWAARTGSSFVVPNLVREADRVFDPTVYDEPGVRGSVLSVLPFARRNLKPVLNGLGEPVSRAWTQRFTSQSKPDPVWRELARLEIGVYPRALQHRGRALTDEELYDVVQTSGPRIRQRLERLIAVPSYSRWREAQQKERIQDIVQSERDRAKARVARVPPRGQSLSAP